MCLSWWWRRGSLVRSSCWDVFGQSEVISRSPRSLFLSLLSFLKKRHYTPYNAPYYRRQRHCFSYWWNTNIVFALNKSGEEKEVSSGISPAARDFFVLKWKSKDACSVHLPWRWQRLLVTGAPPPSSTPAFSTSPFRNVFMPSSVDDGVESVRVSCARPSGCCVQS